MKKINNSEIVSFIREIYNTSSNEIVSLHEPRFISDEKELLNNCIDSTYVSTVGKYVSEFEKILQDFTGAKHAISTSNGTSALHVSILAADIQPKDEIITQAFTFVATCNAIKYSLAEPVFVDISKNTLGMCPKSLLNWLHNNAEEKNGSFFNKNSGSKISAVMPMHTFGHPCEIKEISDICKEYKLALIEDTAEALGSYYENKHLGTFGDIGTLSFNGNKIITTGGGGAVITNDDKLANKIRHLSTTARLKTKYTFDHDEVGYNYRMPNLNASLGIAQMKKIKYFIDTKREVASNYKEFFDNSNIHFYDEPNNAKSNFWLNVLIFENALLRDEALEYTNKNNIITRPPWKLMTKLKMFSDCEKSEITNSEDLESRILNIPSSVPLKN